MNTNSYIKIQIYHFRFIQFNEKDGEVALTQLQKEIESQLEKDHKKKAKHVPSTPKSSNIFFPVYYYLYLYIFIFIDFHD